MSLSALILGPTRAERRTTLVYLFARGLSFASIGYVVGAAISGAGARGRPLLGLPRHRDSQHPL